jgi:hypothetical protein
VPDEVSQDALETAVDDALRKVMQDAAGDAMLTRFTLVAEVADEQGERALRIIGSPDLVPWEAQGLLTWAAAHVDEEFYGYPDDPDAEGC